MNKLEIETAESKPTADGRESMDIKDTGVTVTFPPDVQFTCIVLNRKNNMLEAGGNCADEKRITFPLVAIGAEIAALQGGMKQYVAEKVFRYIAEKAGLALRIERKEEEKITWTH